MSQQGSTRIARKTPSGVLGDTAQCRQRRCQTRTSSFDVGQVSRRSASASPPGGRVDGGCGGAGEVQPGVIRQIPFPVVGSVAMRWHDDDDGSITADRHYLCSVSGPLGTSAGPRWPRVCPVDPGISGGGAGGAAADVGQKAAVGRGRRKCASSDAWIGSPSASAIGCGSRPRPDNMIVAVGRNQCDSDGLACRAGLNRLRAASGWGCRPRSRRRSGL